MVLIKKDENQDHFWSSDKYNLTHFETGLIKEIFRINHIKQDDREKKNLQYKHEIVNSGKLGALFSWWRQQYHSQHIHPEEKNFWGEQICVNGKTLNSNCLKYLKCLSIITTFYSTWVRELAFPKCLPWANSHVRHFTFKSSFNPSNNLS